MWKEGEGREADKIWGVGWREDAGCSPNWLSIPVVPFTIPFVILYDSVLNTKDMKKWTKEISF